MNYLEFINYLFSFQDLKYRDFHFKLLNTNQEVIGIRTPILKKIAKELYKDNIKYFKYCKHKYYEETIIYGLMITLDKDFSRQLENLDIYTLYIDNWASCDIIVANFKSFKKNLDVGFNKVLEYVNSSNPWQIRVGLVLLLTYYINDDYIAKIFKIADNINSEFYYVKMANAWLLSICFIKYFDLTYEYFLTCNLDKWTYNKALQKAIESTRIKNKDILKKLKK